MAYFGPVSEARQYFIDMGYQPANRQTTPDFLVSVTDPEGRTERSVGDSDSEESGSTRRRDKVVPRTAVEFAEYYKKSEIRQENLRDMEAYRNAFVGKEELEKHYRESSRAEHARHTRTKVTSICFLFLSK